MAATVLTGIGGAFAYKPAGTLGSFKSADVSTANNEITIEPFLGFRVGDPVKFAVYNALGGTPAGTLPAPLSGATTYYVIAYAPTTGILKVSATLGGTSVTITNTGTAAEPNEFSVFYADYALVSKVRQFSFEITRSDIDCTTIGQEPGLYAPFKTYQSGFAEGNGTATVFMTREDAAMANRLIEDTLLRDQVGAAVKLYVDRVSVNGVVDEIKSRSLSMDIVLTSANFGANPDDAIAIETRFRPTGQPAFDLRQTS